MAKPRRKTTPDPSHAESLAGSGSAAPVPRNGVPVPLVAALFLAGVVVYVVLFYRVELGPGQFRYRPLGYLLIPDELVSQWAGRPYGTLALFDRWKPFVVAAAIWGFAFLVGRLVLHGLRLRRHLDSLEFFTLATGLGFSGVSLLTLAIGLWGYLRSPAPFALGAMLLLAAAIRQGGRGSRLMPARAVADPDDRPDRARPEKARAVGPETHKAWYQPRWWWAAVPFAWVILAGAVLPPLDFDVLEYHLQVPKEWYQQGQVTFLPHNVYGNMPLGAEMPVTLAMLLTPGELDWWWGALAGKVVMASFTLLTAMLVFAAGRRYFGVATGIVAALVFISTAWIAFVSVNGLNEGVVAYYLFASFFAGKLWWDARAATGRPNWGLLILAGLLSGSAVSCKYTSLTFVVIPLLCVILIAGRTYRMPSLLVFLLAVTATCGLWFGKNWVLTGNPTYPLLVDVFGGETRTAEKDAQWRRAHQVPRDAQGHRYSLSQAGQSALDLLGRSRWHNPLLVPLGALVFLRRSKYRDLKYWAAVLAFVIGVWWLLTHRLDRFWVPAVPLMSLLAGIGATWSASTTWRRILWAIVGLGLAANFVLIASTIGDTRYLVSLEQLRDDPRMTMMLRSHRSIAHAYLRDCVRPGSRALLVGDAAVFDMQVPVLYNTCFDDCIFEQIFRGRNQWERRARLAEEKVSHIYVDWAEIRRYRQPGNYGFTDYVTRRLVEGELVQQQKLLRRLDVPGLDPERGEVFAVY